MERYQDKDLDTTWESGMSSGFHKADVYYESRVKAAKILAFKLGEKKHKHDKTLAF